MNDHARVVQKDIADRLGELAKIAHDDGRELLAYLIEMAWIEALNTEQLAEVLPQKGEKPNRPAPSSGIECGA